MLRYLTAAVAAAAACLLLLSPASPASGARAQGGPGRFDLGCEFSHSLPDDPIVFPGQPGASHMHDFFGFRRTDAFSTPEQMRADLEADPTLSSCVEDAGERENPDADNASGYWEPSVYVNGVKVDPNGVHAYYRNDSRGNVEVPPLGFRVVAGDPMAPPEEQRGKLTWWCGAKSGGAFDHIPSDCDQHDAIHVGVSFPSCWNGELDSESHHDHVVYPSDFGGRCPRSHPRRLPRILLHTEYNVREALGRRLQPETDELVLSSGPMTSMHADYLFAWNERLEFLRDNCLNAGRDCKRHPPE